MSNYSVEGLLQKIPNLTDEELQWDYFNDLKWTQPAALMMGLLDKDLALRVVKLALQVHWQLGVRLAGEVKQEYGEEAFSLVDNLDIPVLLKIRLLGKSKSLAAISRLIKLLEYKKSIVRDRAAEVLEEIKSEAAIPGLIKLLQHKNVSIVKKVINLLGILQAESAIGKLIPFLEHQNLSVRQTAIDALLKIESVTAITQLIKLLDSEDLSICINAISVLGEIRSHRAIPKLIELLDSQDDSIIIKSISALGEIKSEVAILKSCTIFNNHLGINSKAQTQSLIAADWVRLLVRFNVLCILASELIPRRVFGLNDNGARCENSQINKTSGCGK